MSRLLIACVAVLALAGCEKSRNTSITRTHANGVDTLYSKSTVVDGEARFQCIASSSGHCHYRCWTQRAAPMPRAPRRRCVGLRLRQARPRPCVACPTASASASAGPDRTLPPRVITVAVWIPASLKGQ